MFKALLLRFLITALSLAAVIAVVPGIIFHEGIVYFLELAGVIYILNFLTKPFVKIFFLPVEIATLGLVSIGLNTAAFWFLPRFIPGFKITSFWFSGFANGSFLVAPIEVPGIVTAVIGAMMIALVSTILYWLIK